jgi:hypothetical protein
MWGNVRLVGDTHTCTKMPGYEADEAGPTAEFEHIHALKSESTTRNVAR